MWLQNLTSFDWKEPETSLPTNSSNPSNHKYLTYSGSEFEDRSQIIQSHDN